MVATLMVTFTMMTTRMEGGGMSTMMTIIMMKMKMKMMMMKMMMTIMVMSVTTSKNMFTVQKCSFQVLHNYEKIDIEGRTVRVLPKYITSLLFPIDDDYDESEESDSDESEESVSDGYQEESSSRIKEIICEVLRENGVNPNNVKYQYRRDAKGFAWFNCPRRHHNWPSVHAWCVIDLYNQSITSPYEQDCKKCNSSAYPKFKPDMIRKMVLYVVNCYLVKIGKRQYVSSTDIEKPGNQKGPHDEERCGKCRRLGRSCWK